MYNAYYAQRPIFFMYKEFLWVSKKKTTLKKKIEKKKKKAVNKIYQRKKQTKKPKYK